MSKKIALLAVAGAVAILGAGVLGYFSYGWINPPEPPPVTLSKGNVRGKVLTDSGSMTPAGIIVEDEEGNTQRLTTNAFGGYDLQLYPGKYRLTFTKGYEFDTVTKEVEVQQYKTYYLQDVRLMQLYDSYEKHWIAGDLHQHTYYSDGSDSILSLALGDVSVGLYYGFLSDHNSARGLAEWYETDTLKTLTAEDGEDRFFTPGEAVEITTEFGHFQALGVATTLEKYDVELYESERNSPDRDQIIMDRITYIANCIKRDGGVAQINHPYSVSTMGFNYWELAPLFDTVEISNGVFNPGDGRYENETGYISQNYESKLKWYELLNEGLYLAATGGTDIHDTKGPGKTGGVTAITPENYQSYYDDGGIYPGMPTTYLYLDGAIDRETILGAIEGGHSFISNGPVINCKVGETIYGQTHPLAGASEVTFDMDVFCRDGIESIAFVRNGETVKSIELDVGTDTVYTQPVTLEVSAGDWVVIEVFGTGAQYGITNPIFFEA